MQILSTTLISLVKFHDDHRFLSVAITGVVVTVPVLYYLYERNLNHWKFRTENWGSYEIERGVRCNKAIKDASQLLQFVPHKLRQNQLIKTVYDCFMHGFEVSSDGPCLGHLVDSFTKCEWFTYSQVRKDAQLIGKLLRSRAIQRQQNVGIYAKNCCEYLITQVGCMIQSIVSVPLYDTLGLESIYHTINETEMAAIFCDSEDKLKQILSEKMSSSGQFSALKLFIYLNEKVPKDSQLPQRCKEVGVEFLTWSEAKLIGEQFLATIDDDPPRPDDIYVLLYTSGTTGLSKGVVHSHANVIACLAGHSILVHMTAPLERLNLQGTNSNDCNMMYLPMAHSYGQFSTVGYFYAGARIGFPSGNIQRLFLDAQIMKPTYFPLVPRIMNRLHTKILSETKAGFKGWFFWKCYERKRALLQKRIVTRNSIYDWICFRKFQKMLGGNVRTMSVGSAPIAPEVLEFWRVVFGALINEAYGLTESVASATSTNEIDGGHVGHPTCSTLVRLLDVPELGYTIDNKPPQGEICLKGPGLMKGYYKRPDLTQEVFTPDGWFRTGDIGEFLPNGCLRLIDRRKHLFKLSQGEYVAPEKIESVYAQCHLVAQVFVDGDSLQQYLVAVVVPEEKDAKEWAVKNGHVKLSFAEICANRQFQRYVLDSMISVGKRLKLNSLEQAKSIYLEAVPFTVANGLMTPTLKNRRADLHRRYQPEIQQLYKAGPLIDNITRD